ncbi:STAS domain-containing protein [Blastococcus sp. VKM Ac-2987]|uniref:STAS domain-containing protein n=1 Tax=Blastococcus sp. VKM Ac-2987 TaxID=3004141 RepID=UPI0022AB57ED|nr:STAS domain-containing protein [Blastococcus sp. VKM Ac-2987]MCZ2860037.1 STAS domain-containing protein [Blastococcus sp. VKM Ac-2987]
MLFDVERSTIAGRPALTVRGELDIATAPQLADAAEALLASSPAAIVVDLTPTVFLDSSGAHTLVTITRRAAAAGTVLHVVAPRANRPVRLPIDLLQLDTVVPIVDSAGEIPGIAAGHDAT